MSEIVMESCEVDMLIRHMVFSEEDFVNYIESNLESVRCGQIEWSGLCEGRRVRPKCRLEKSDMLFGENSLKNTGITKCCEVFCHVLVIYLK